jgi:hypothetical protein
LPQHVHALATLHQFFRSFQDELRTPGVEVHRQEYDIAPGRLQGRLQACFIQFRTVFVKNAFADVPVKNGWATHRIGSHDIAGWESGSQGNVQVGRPGIAQQQDICPPGFSLPAKNSALRCAPRRQPGPILLCSVIGIEFLQGLGILWQALRPTVGDNQGRG